MSKRFAIEYTKSVTYVGFVTADHWTEAQTRFFDEGPDILEKPYITGSDIRLNGVEDAIDEEDR